MHLEGREWDPNDWGEDNNMKHKHGCYRHTSSTLPRSLFDHLKCNKPSSLCRVIAPFSERGSTKFVPSRLVQRPALNASKGWEAMVVASLYNLTTAALIEIQNGGRVMTRRIRPALIKHLKLALSWWYFSFTLHSGSMFEEDISAWNASTDVPSEDIVGNAIKKDQTIKWVLPQYFWYNYDD